MVVTSDTTELFRLYEKHGNSTYIGEPVTFLQHSLQCGAIAESEGCDIDTVLGAFLHDIGHLLGFEDDTPKLIGDHGTVLGAVDHENRGADYLEKIGFPKSVTDVVRHHVNAKRYKVSINEEYMAKISPASMQTLRLQGGPMEKDELAIFAKHPRLQAILLVRTFDERAKDPNAKTPPLSYFKELCDNYLANLNN